MEGMLALLIPIIALSIPIVAIWTKHQQKLAEMQIETTASASAEKAAQYATQIQRLEDRVQADTTSPPRSKRCVTAARSRIATAACR